MFKAVELLEHAKTKRDTAARARRWADQLFAGTDRERLLQYATELDEQAADLERQAAGEPASPSRPSSS